MGIKENARKGAAAERLVRDRHEMWRGEKVERIHHGRDFEVTPHDEIWTSENE